MGRVSGKIALVTGGSMGMGESHCRLLAREGAKVIIVDVPFAKEDAEKLAQELNGDVILEDITDAKATADIQQYILNNYKGLDILVNNAGLAKGLAPIQEGNLDHWEQMIDTNIKGVLYVTRAVTPGMVARRRGHVINISSSAGKEVYLNGNVYCATKFAIEALTKAMRLDLHSHNIRVSQVSPGHVEETEFAITRFDGDAERARIYNDFQPLKSSDVAEAIYWMATRPPHVNVQDIQLFSTQQASATVVNRSGRD